MQKTLQFIPKITVIYFLNINAVEVKTANDTIDFEIRLQKVHSLLQQDTVVGNETNDRYRELEQNRERNTAKKN
jgi:outer membrane protein insertion porin family